MKEREFGDHVKSSLGTPPAVDRARIESALSRGVSRGPFHAVGPAAATIGLLVVGAFVGWRLLGQPQRTAGPQTTTTPSASASVAATASVCKVMPVLVQLESGPPGQQANVAGFLDTATASITTDAKASVAGVPGGDFPGTVAKPSQPSHPAFYSWTLRRWLPVADGVSPDQRSYVWERLLPEGSNFNDFQTLELHRYDVVSGHDRTLWTTHDQAIVLRWDDPGIHVETTPMSSGQTGNWLIDPLTGKASPEASQSPPRLTQLPSDPLQNGGFGYASFGASFHGHPIYEIGSRDAGSPEIVLYETAPGQRVIIYQGHHGDATDFDPLFGFDDPTGVWFTDFTGNLWRWQPDGTLKKMTVTGLPGLLSGPNSGRYIAPAGTCGG
ncbi:MAG TPA: hypothetical protein VIT43_14595 [Candidatus Dormibacteraeota bacterium]